MNEKYKTKEIHTAENIWNQGKVPEALKELYNECITKYY